MIERYSEDDIQGTFTRLPGGEFLIHEVQPGSHAYTWSTAQTPAEMAGQLQSAGLLLSHEPSIIHETTSPGFKRLPTEELLAKLGSGATVSFFRAEFGEFSVTWNQPRRLFTDSEASVARGGVIAPKIDLAALTPVIQKTATPAIARTVGQLLRDTAI